VEGTALMKPKNDGSEFQKAFQEVAEALQKNSRCLWHRFTDSKAARGYVKEQPGDFMLLAGGTAHLFELKSTEAGEPLKDMLKTKEGKRQVAQARKWERAGGGAWFLWADLRTREVQVHALRHVLNDMWLPYGTGHLDLLGTLLQDLIGVTQKNI
jgi:hypothetical protein